jgi:signal transduction histidine kinase
VVELLYQEKKIKGKLHGIDFHLNLKTDIPLVLGNDYQLYNCIENIVNNSIEAMPEGGELFIETGVQDGFVLISIRDTGPGIPDEVMKNLFKPFFTTKTIGSGLGLYTSKEIIERMGGNIAVSCEMGKGCRVSINLPVLKGVGYEQNLSSG